MTIHNTTEGTPMTTNVLFTCPHAAGKSLFAATYFRAAASRAGIDVVIAIAGPEPDPHNMTNVQAALEAQGHIISWHPKLVEEADTDAADIIISVGCDHADIPTDKQITDWNAPLLSEDFSASMNAIHAHAEALANQLARGG